MTSSIEITSTLSNNLRYRNLFIVFLWRGGYRANTSNDKTVENLIRTSSWNQTQVVSVHVRLFYLYHSEVDSEGWGRFLNS